MDHVDGTNLPDVSLGALPHTPRCGGASVGGSGQRFRAATQRGGSRSTLRYRRQQGGVDVRLRA